ncbi:MAG: DUF1499 domain-containing protein [Aestuariivirga sp.]|uniref:DUF1499 domain-containing protein n=1 Tax=Aestuariivirga sp. TaxID=2650926 RepID=UPI0025BDB0DC|nr:DUF1499 domain-containing protein [Aestuariivirga sp.]MCA3560550.1 DUF1499 domain-containing protein [Aestuariivirga sp.]
MRRVLKAFAGLVAVIFIAVPAAFLILGPERLWEQFGPADLGDVDFATLVRRDTPNDALACLPEFCVAKADIPAPAIAKPFGDVFLAVQDAVVHEPGLEQVDADSGQGTLRFVERSPLMKFPDTINLKVVPAQNGGSAVLIYSRSQLGQSDMGVNLARVKRWADLIEAAARNSAP